jgi:secreted trypsin-like serine protease
MHTCVDLRRGEAACLEAAHSALTAPRPRPAPPQFPVYNLTDANICAGVLAGGHDSCNGDSGGPLFVRGATAAADVAVGLTSFGEGCAQKGVPAGYTNLRKYAAWVAATLKAEGFVMPAPATPIKTKTG